MMADFGEAAADTTSRSEPDATRFLRLLSESKDILLSALVDAGGDAPLTEHEKAFIQDEFLPIARKANRLARSGSITESEAQAAPMALVLAELLLLPGTTLQSIFQSIQRCTVVEGARRV
jgi:hypothetical protein